MKFFHLSDLHIGKQLHHYNLREDQEAVLMQVAEYAGSIRPDAVVIAGDIYDRSVPSAEAVTVFDEFLTRLSAITPAIPVLIISGNHDSAERLEYASAILKRHQIYLAGTAPRDETEHLKKVTLEDEYGEVDFYLMPFLKPSHVRNVFRDEAPQTYTDAVAGILGREEIDYENRRNVLVSHQFYTGEAGGGDSPATCDSEVFSVGGIENVDVSAAAGFDYVALGHLHGPQDIRSRQSADVSIDNLPYIRYCGTLLKYSISEYRHEKSLTVVTLGEKGSAPKVELLPIHPLRDVKKKVGNLADILSQAEEKERDDYVSITLTDDVDPYKPKEQLQKVFTHILEVRVDNKRTRQKLKELDEEPGLKDPIENFAEFYQEMQGRELDEKERDVILVVVESILDG